MLNATRCTECRRMLSPSFFPLRETFAQGRERVCVYCKIKAERKLAVSNGEAKRKRLQATLRGEVLGKPVQTRPRHAVKAERDNQTTARHFLWLYQPRAEGEA